MEKSNYIGKEVKYYIRRENKTYETKVEDVRELDSGKLIAELENGTVISLDILDFEEEGKEEDNGEEENS